MNSDTPTQSSYNAKTRRRPFPRVSRKGKKRAGMNTSSQSAAKCIPFNARQIMSLEGKRIYSVDQKSRRQGEENTVNSSSSTRPSVCKKRPSLWHGSTPTRGNSALRTMSLPHGFFPCNHAYISASLNYVVLDWLKDRVSDFGCRTTPASGSNQPREKTGPAGRREALTR